MRPSDFNNPIIREMAKNVEKYYKETPPEEIKKDIEKVKK